MEYLTPCEWQQVRPQLQCASACDVTRRSSVLFDLKHHSNSEGLHEKEVMQKRVKTTLTDL